MDRLTALRTLAPLYDGAIPRAHLEALVNPPSLSDRLAYAEQELRFYTSRAPSYIGTEHQKHFDSMIARYTREVAELRAVIETQAA